MYVSGTALCHGGNFAKKRPQFCWQLAVIVINSEKKNLDTEQKHLKLSILEVEDIMREKQAQDGLAYCTRGAHCDFFDDDPMLIAIRLDEHWFVDIILQYLSSSEQNCMQSAWHLTLSVAAEIRTSS